MQSYKQEKLVFTTLVAIFTGSVLAWQYLHDGVPSHHILQREDLPEISNWWGLLVLPVVTWILLTRIEKRMLRNAGNHNNGQVFPVALRFAVGLATALLIVLSFSNKWMVILDNVPYTILGLSLFMPIYFAEYMLGFILGMAFSFGAVLPTVFVLVIAAIGFGVYTFIRQPLLRLVKSFTRGR